MGFCWAGSIPSRWERWCDMWCDSEGLKIPATCGHFWKSCGLEACGSIMSQPACFCDTQGYGIVSFLLGTIVLRAVLFKTRVAGHQAVHLLLCQGCVTPEPKLHLTRSPLGYRWTATAKLPLMFTFHPFTLYKYRKHGSLWGLTRQANGELLDHPGLIGIWRWLRSSFVMAASAIYIAVSALQLGKSFHD